MGDAIGQLIFGAIILAALTSCTIANPGEGTKVGQVTRVQPEGLMCKTTTAVVTGKFGGGEIKVTVPARMMAQVDKFQDTQEQVKIAFHTDFIRTACSNDTNNTFLDSIESHPEGAAK